MDDVHTKELIDARVAQHRRGPLVQEVLDALLDWNAMDREPSFDPNNVFDVYDQAAFIAGSITRQAANA